LVFDISEFDLELSAALGTRKHYLLVKESFFKSHFSSLSSACLSLILPEGQAYRKP
jgi:hypothetical protein